VRITARRVDDLNPGKKNPNEQILILFRLRVIVENKKKSQTSGKMFLCPFKITETARAQRSKNTTAINLNM